MTDAHERVPNSGQDVDDATEPDLEYDQLGSDGNPFERIDTPSASRGTSSCVPQVSNIRRMVARSAPVTAALAVHGV